MEFEALVFGPRKTQAYKFHPHDQDIWLHLERSRVVEWLRDHSYITKHWIGWVGSEIGHALIFEWSLIDILTGQLGHLTNHNVKQTRQDTRDIYR